MTRQQRAQFGFEMVKALRAKYGWHSVPRGVLAVCLGCSHEAIRVTEERALRKIRRAMTPDDWDLLNYIFQCDRITGRPKAMR